MTTPCRTAVPEFHDDPAMERASPIGPAFNDLPFTEQVESLADDYAAADLATMYLTATLQIDVLRAQIRNAERDAARWLEVSRHGPAPMQIMDPAVGVITRNGADADRHVDAAIAERKASAVKVRCGWCEGLGRVRDYARTDIDVFTRCVRCAGTGSVVQEAP